MSRLEWGFFAPKILCKVGFAMAEILFSKLMPPREAQGIIMRPRLLKQFSGPENRKLTLLTAPAGYGKTVFLSQLAGSIQKPLLWYQLDSYDNDPAVFLQYLLTGLGQHFPEFGAKILQQGLVTHGRLLVTAIVNELEEKAQNGVVIALEDYHLVTEPAIHGLIGDLLEHLPPGSHFLITSRTPPPLVLSRLKVRGEVLIAGPEELRFTRQEIADFLARNGKAVSDQVLATLESKTSGWPAALRLVGDSAAGVGDLLEKHSRREIYDYLATEVLDRQPEEIRSFLRDTAVLEELTAAFCDQLLERNDSGGILSWLEERQLFVIPLGGGGVYRYHQLFQEFLQTQLPAERRQVLLARAGQLSRQAGQLENAVKYLSGAGFTADLYAVIQEASRQALSRGHWQMVAGWLELLPAEVLANEPWFALYKARIEMYRGRLNEAEKWIQRAEKLFADRGDQSGLVESRLLQAPILQRQGRYQESLDLLEWAAAFMGEAEKASRFDLIMERAFCLAFTGRYGETQAVLVAALEQMKPDDNYVRTHLLEALGDIFWMQGRYPQALQTYRKAAEISPDRILPGYYTQDLITRIYQDWGEWEQAFDYIQRSIAIKENYGLTEALPSAYHLLGELYYDKKEWSLAQTYLQRAIDLLRENDGDKFALTMIRCSLTECLGLQGRWIEARSQVQEAFAEAPPQSPHALAVCQLYGFLPCVHTGSFAEGSELLAAGMATFQKLGFKKGLGYAYAFQAWRAFQAKDPVKAGEYTEQALVVAAQLNDQTLFLRWESLLQPVLRLGLKIGVEVVFIQRILVRMGERALPLLVDLAGQSGPEVRQRVIAPLAEIGGPGVRAQIVSLTEDPDGEVRLLARLTAQRLGIGGAVQFEVPAACLEVLTLGVFQVFWQGRESDKADWRTLKTRDLLAYLVHQGEPAGREKIIEALWPEIDQDSAVALFHTTLYYLRKVLKKMGCPEMIHYSGQRYQLRPENFRSDRQRFQEMATAGLRPGLAPEKAAGILEEAVSLYRGDYLDDLDYTWVLHLKENLRHLCAGARKYLVRYYLMTPDYLRAENHLKTLEQYEPFDEETHGLLLTVYARQGNRSAVKLHFDKMASLLKKELGLTPSRTICDLYAGLIDNSGQP